MRNFMTNYISSDHKRFQGVFPIVPTPFSDDGALDLESQRRVLDCMVDQGSDGICILANYSEQFLLSDYERDQLLDLSLAYVAGRTPVIVTVSHFSTRIATERAQAAARAGAAMLMVMPPYHGATLRADEAQAFEHYESIAHAVSIPLMVQDAPLSGVNLSVDFLLRLAQDIDQVRYFKVEQPGTAGKLRALIEQGGAAVEGPFDGEEAITLLADLDAGATGTMPSALLPELIKPVVDAHLAGERDKAKEQYRRILPLINYENRQCGLRATKLAMQAGGVIKSAAVRHPLVSLNESAAAGLMELVEDLRPLCAYWGH